MMRFSILIFLFVSQKCFSQFNFSNDSSYHWYPDYFLRQVDSIYHLDTTAEFEFRYKSGEGISRNKKMLILTYKNGKWCARYFVSNRMEDYTVREIILNGDPSALWANLGKYDILNLPSSNQLKDSTGNTPSLPIYDGIGYSFEFYSRNNKRGYSYHCPDHYRKSFPNIKEFESITHIIGLINAFCGIPVNFICFHTEYNKGWPKAG